jgi:hypothetical protein
LRAEWSSREPKCLPGGSGRQSRDLGPHRADVNELFCVTRGGHYDAVILFMRKSFPRRDKGVSHK